MTVRSISHARHVRDHHDVSRRPHHHALSQPQASADLDRGRRDDADARTRLETTRAELSAVQLRCDALANGTTAVRVELRQLSETRASRERDMARLTKSLFARRQRRQALVDTLKRRRLNQVEEIDPYRVPARLRPGRGDDEDVDRVAVSVQAMWRSHRSRRQQLDALDRDATRLESEIETIRTDMAKRLDPRIRVLTDRVESMRRQHEEKSKEATTLSGVVATLERDEVPTCAKRVTRCETVLRGAQAHLARARRVQRDVEQDDCGRAPLTSSAYHKYEDAGTKSIRRGEAPSTVRMLTDAPSSVDVSKTDRAMALLTAAAEETDRLLTSSSANGTKKTETITEDEDSSTRTRSRRLERGWRGGGHGRPRMETSEGDDRRPCTIPYTFPDLEPASMRRKREKAELWTDALVTTARESKSSSSSSRRPRPVLSTAPFVVTSEEIQRDLPISTKGSARQVIERVRRAMSSSAVKTTVKTT